MQRDYNRGRFPTSIIAIGAALVAVVVIVMFVFMFFASRGSYYGYGGYYGGMMGGFGGWGMLFMVPIGIIVLAIIGYVIWRGFGWGRGCCENGNYRHYSSYGDKESAMEILRQRYAKGEISKEQFEQMKRDIVS